MHRLVSLNKMDFCYWIDELPELKVENEHEKVIELKQRDKVLNFPLQMALELSLHKQVSNYAMLGFSYIPEDGTDSLIARINYYNRNSISYLSQIRNDSG